MYEYIKPFLTLTYEQDRFMVWGIFLYTNTHTLHAQLIPLVNYGHMRFFLAVPKYFPVANFVYSCHNLCSIQAPARLPGISPFSPA